MATGFIKLHRKIAESSFYFSEKFTKTQAFIDLLLLANFKESSFILRGNVIPINAGEFCRSLDYFAERWKLNKRTVMKYIQFFQFEGMIEVKKHSANINIYRIVNWQMYQITDEKSTLQKTIDNTEANTLFDDTDTPQNALQDALVIRSIKNYNNNTSKSAKKTKSQSVQNSENDSYQDLFNAEQSNSLEFAEMWELWIEYLKERGKPLLKSTAKIHLNKLSKYPISVQLKMIEKSIECKWQGLFPLSDADMKAIATEIKQDELSFNPVEWVIYESN